MEDSKRKYLYITLCVLAVLVVLYLTYSLVAHGSPLIKSVNEHLISGNELHNDSLYDEAMIEYGKAYSMDSANTVSAYNRGTNLLLKNYQDMKSGKVENGIIPDTIVMQRYEEAEKMMAKSIEGEKVEKNKELVAKAGHNLGLAHHHRMELKEAEAAYKESLRNDPANENTRYNLAVVQYLLKNQQNQQNQQQQNQQQEQQNQQQQQQEEQQDQSQQQQEQNQEQNQQQEQKNQEQEQQQQDEKKENYERMLEALMQDEKELREDMEEKKAVQGIKMDLEKNW